MQPRCLAGELGLCLKNRSHKRTKKKERKEKTGVTGGGFPWGKAQICIEKACLAEWRGQQSLQGPA